MDAAMDKMLSGFGTPANALGNHGIEDSEKFG
jgi:hypothetical protein